MQKEIKKFSPIIYAIALICFFLPFITVSCQEHKLVTLTGIQLVTGTKIEQPSMFREQKKATNIPSDARAVLAFFIVIIGLFLSFLKGKKTALAPAIAGVIGLILLLLLKTNIDDNVLKEGGGVLRIEYDIGFWLTLLSFISATGLNGYLFFQDTKEVGVKDIPKPTAKDNVPYKEKTKEVQFLTHKTESTTKNCPFCQEEITANATICKYCGEYIETKVKTADLPPKQEKQPKPKIFSGPKAPVDFSKEQKIPQPKSIAEKETYIPQPSTRDQQTMIFTGAKLVIQGGAMDGKNFPIVAMTTTIGRRENKVISIDEPTLSRDHATLTMEGDKFILKNESKLGTKVNGVAIESIELKYGDVIQMGAIKIMFNKEA